MLVRTCEDTKVAVCSDIMDAIRSRRLRCAGDAWRSQNPLLHVVIEEKPVGRPRLRWKGVAGEKREVAGRETGLEGTSGRQGELEQRVRDGTVVMADGR